MVTPVMKKQAAIAQSPQFGMESALSFFDTSLVTGFGALVSSLSRSVLVSLRRVGLSIAIMSKCIIEGALHLNLGRCALEAVALPYLNFVF